jgi:hypothetical protein
MRADGETTMGTKIGLADDLNLPRNPSIPIYGGGEIGGWGRGPGVGSTFSVTGVAEYWAHTWKGHDVLANTESLDDRTFAAGSAVESRFRLSCLTLDIQMALEDGPIRIGGYLSLQVRSATLRMESGAVEAKNVVNDLLWGGGLFVEYRPIPYLLAGASVKGFSPFGDGDETGAGDFRIYGGVQWGPARLEGGFRSVVYDFTGADESLGYSLNGAYVQVSVIVRF